MSFDYMRPNKTIVKMSVIVVLSLLLFSAAMAFFSTPLSQQIPPSGNPQSGASGSAQSDYSITFVENGLPVKNGYQWSVVFNNVTQRTTGSDIVFDAQNGSYNYTVHSTSNFYPVKASGTVNVSGSNRIVNVPFAGKNFLVTFRVSDFSSVKGASSGYNTWSVNFDGMNNTTQKSQVNFLAKNGTYSYEVTAPSGYFSTPSSGQITVSGSSVLVDLSFNTSLYRLSFNEQGLPATANSKLVPEWSVEISGTPLASPLSLGSNSSSVSAHLPAGVYTYSIRDPSGYFSSPSSGQITLSNSNLVQTVQFLPKNYKLKFSETGLPGSYVHGSYGTEWGVKIVNTASGAALTQYSSTSSIYFYSVNGTYNYYILNLSGYTASPSSGTVVVNGYNYLVPVKFSSDYYTVTFKEIGLPSSGGSNLVSPWTVSMNYQSAGILVMTETSNTSSVTFRSQSGTYGFTVSPIQGFSISPSTGTLTAANITKNVYFNRTTNYYSTSTSSSITFIEHGLPSNTQWAVTLANSSGPVTSTSDYQDIVFNAYEGAYFYSINNIGPYFAGTPSSMINTTTTSGTVNVYFSYQYRPLVFHETGLPYNTTWSVALSYPDGSTYVLTSQTNNITFMVPNGTYNYRLVSSGFYQPSNSQGTERVQGSSIVPSGPVTVKFDDASSVVAFSESGLPAYTPWTVSLLSPAGNLVTRSTSYGALDFAVPNGTYRFFAYYTGPYEPSELSGTLVVTGSTVAVFLSFTKHTHYITFNQKGLPKGTSWHVVLGNRVGFSSSGSNITFSVTNGSYYYMVEPSGNYWSNISSGQIYFSGTNLQVNVTFKQRFYTVTVNETGLTAGTKWDLTLGGKLYTSTGSSITLQRENGSYNFSLTSNSNYYSVPSDGLAVVAGKNTFINIDFRSQLYNVYFRESNLPDGFTWKVVLSNSMELTSNGPGPLDFQLSNGTYSYTVYGSNHYVPAPGYGTISVKGQGITVNVTFKIYKYALTFKETSGLPSGDTWYVNVTASNGTIYSESTTSSSLSFDLLNGTYSYGIASQNKSVSSNAGGSVTILGSSKTLELQFSPVKYTVTLKESGLPKNTTWYVDVNGQNETLTSNNLTLLLSNGTYSYTVPNLSDYNATANTGTFTVNGSNITLKVSYTPVSHTTVVPPPVQHSLPFNKIVLYILIAIGAIGLLVIFVVYTRGRRK